MAGGSIFGTGVSALLAFQRALDTTGHNIANVNTPGFSRQRVDLDTRVPQASGNGFIGNGVNVSTVERMFDQFLVGNVRTQTSLNSELQSYSQFAGQVDNLLADPQAGLSPALQDFFSAVQGVADDPASIPARQVMLTEGESLAERFDYLASRLNNLGQGVRQQLTNVINEVNALTDSIAKLNTDIRVQEGAAGGQPANDLRDKRDEIIRELSELVSVDVVQQSDGAMNVFVGSGQALVVGNSTQKLGLTGNAYDASQPEITISSGNGTGVVVTNSITGGQAGGLLRFQNEVLDPALNNLGRVAVGLTEEINAQHQLGLDLNNALGGDFFSPLNIDVKAHANNSGVGSVSATFSAVSDLSASDYVLRFDGGTSYTLTRLSDNSTFGVDTSVPATLDVEGMNLSITAGAVVGDTFKIRPTRFAATDIDMAIGDPREIAVAGPLRSAETFGNTGSAEISQASVSSANPAVLPLAANNGTITLSYVDDPVPANRRFVVTDASGTIDTLFYDPASESAGKSFTLAAPYDGISFEMSGTPLAGDSFSITDNTSGVTDNRNALELTDLQRQNLLIGGTTDFQGAYGQFVAEVGTRTHQANISSDAQQVLLQQAVGQRESVSGVNLDEEAANLLKYQQAYQAAAQVITVGNSLFQTILGAVRG